MMVSGKTMMKERRNFKNVLPREKKIIRFVKVDIQ